ncbi:hypothetical protein CKAH01_15894 [Colletotrichum kahawae]|uniref:Uncharacterized protein n=1 Tax=Colletotrichum kahawae TaxID=34407 RepID=A0AAE0D764_COLKA|nr:hypothetical protein CKAH01_15894 [Colletotrichum kahawae]
MRSLYHHLIILLSLFSLVWCDELDDYGYKRFDTFIIDKARGRIIIEEAYNAWYDSPPRLKLRDIMVFIWVRADMSLSDLTSVQIRDVSNQGTKDAIADARASTGIQAPTDFTVEENGIGWRDLINAEFYYTVSKMCNDWQSLSSKRVSKMTVLSKEGRLDDFILYIS